MQNRTVFGMLFATALLGAGVACSSTATTTTDPNKTNNSTPDGGGNNNENPDSGGTPTGNGKSGSVSITQTSITIGNNTTYTTQASAYFSSTSGTVTGGGGNTPSCETTTDSGCTITVCDAVEPSEAGAPDGGTESAKPPNAGQIDIKTLEDITLTVDDGTGLYKSYSGSKKLFEKDGQVKVTAAGADVPAFDDTINAPPAVTLTKPTVTLGQKVQIDSSAAYDLTWTDGSAGSLIVSIIAVDSSKKSASLTCTFDASTGSASIPAGIMSKLVKGDGTFSANGATISSLKAGDYDVALRATATAAFGTATVK